MTHDKPIAVQISAGELIDKITILELKAAHFIDPGKLRHVLRELEMLQTVRDQTIPSSPELSELGRQLKAVNSELWQIEDAIRLCEQKHDFGPQFTALARSVYRCNDRRCQLKRCIDELVGSSVVEEKSYTSYS